MIHSVNSGPLNLQTFGAELNETQKVALAQLDAKRDASEQQRERDLVAG